MLQRMLVPLDGSQRADHALALAARLARANGGSLFLVRVVDAVREGWIYSPLTTPYLRDIEEQERAEAQKYLAGKMAASEFAGINMHALVVSGSTPSTLLQVVQRERIDLIVLCSHGYTGFKRWALGRSSPHRPAESGAGAALARTASGSEREGGSACLRCGRVGRFAVCRSRTSASGAARYSFEFPAEGELLLLTAVDMPTAQEERACQQHGLDVNLRQAAFRVADDYLQATRMKLLRELSASRLAHIAWSVIEDGDIAHALLQAAEEGKGSGIQQPSDVLVLTTHGRSGIQRWILGSITERVLQGSMLPLLVVHAHEALPSPLAEQTASDEGLGH